MLSKANGDFPAWALVLAVWSPFYHGSERCGCWWSVWEHWIMSHFTESSCGLALSFVCASLEAARSEKLGVLWFVNILLSWYQFVVVCCYFQRWSLKLCIKPLGMPCLHPILAPFCLHWSNLCKAQQWYIWRKGSFQVSIHGTTILLGREVHASTFI